MSRSLGRIAAAACALTLAATGPAAAPAVAQDVLDHSPNLSGGWVGIPWTLHTRLPHRFLDANPTDELDVDGTTTFLHALGLPWSSLAGVAYAVSSPTVAGEPDELQPFVRHRLLHQPGAVADLALTAAWNTAAGSLDAEATAARAFGAVRLIGAARVFTDARGAGDPGSALAAGAVWRPLSRRAPLALAGDVAVPLAGDGSEDPAWSAGVQAGIPYTPLTLSLQASNAAAVTLQGTTFGTDRVRYGFELTLPIPAGYFLGGYPARDAAVEAVVAEPRRAAAVVVEIRRYEYGPVRVEVPAGSVVEWVNQDEVVHTATAEDAAWDSGAIPPGASWSARFDEPGTYPYYCGPHPFMKGVIIVKPPR